MNYGQDEQDYPNYIIKKLLKEYAEVENELIRITERYQNRLEKIDKKIDRFYEIGDKND